MMPPLYPNSQQTSKDDYAGYWGYNVTERYDTSDSIAVVDAWYSSQLPTFKRTPTGSGVSFDNPAAGSLLTRIIGDVIGNGSRPDAGLAIYPDPKNPNLTQIMIMVVWPAS